MLSRTVLALQNGLDLEMPTAQDYSSTLVQIAIDGFPVMGNGLLVHSRSASYPRIVPSEGDSG
jgi:hypothetical protein